ncbi:MAG: hypothetical protein ACI3XH_03590 [Phascolarctobacterium sp.]
MLKKIMASVAVATLCLTLTACKMPWADAKQEKSATVSTTTTSGTPDVIPTNYGKGLAAYSYLNTVAVTENMSVKVYVDGTASMAGYTNKTAPSVYKDIVKSLEPLFHARWKSNKIEFVRFGDAYVPFNGEDFLKFEKEDFYQDKDTRLDNVIKDTDNRNLSIIITDLFQTNQHYTSLSNALESKCFGNQADRGFAIIGVKSQFKGKIYDIANHAPVEYSSEEGNVGSYRPLYMLVIGNDVDVKVFAYELQRKFSGLKVSLFTNEYGHNNALALGEDFGKTKGGFQNKGDKDGKAKDGIIHIKAKSGDKVKDKLVLVGKKLPVGIPHDYDVEVINLEKLTNDSGQGIIDKILSFFFDDKATYKKVDNKDLVTGTVNLSYDGADIKSTVDLSVDAKKDNEGKYKVTLGLFTSREDYVNSQNVFDAWNFDENRVPGSDAEIGQKTQSISAFTKLVADKHYMQDKPGMRNIVFYLDIE